MGRLQSSSLIEVTVSLVIIGMIFAIATMIFLNVQKGGIESEKLSARLLVNKVMVASLKERGNNKHEFDFDGIVVSRTILNYDGLEELTEIRLEARDRTGRLLCEKKYLIYDSR